MKRIIPFVVLALLSSCVHHDPHTETATTKDQHADSSQKGIDTMISKKRDTASLMNISTDILLAAKDHDYTKFSSFIHPEKGIRFHPYSSMDTAKAYSADQLLTLAKQKKKVDWGSGFGEPEKLTVDQYFAQYVYNVDYLKLGSRSFNDLHRGPDAGIPVAVLNKQEISPNHDIVEYFFHSTKKDEELNWSAVRLYFEWENNTPYLVAVISDRWAP